MRRSSSSPAMAPGEAEGAAQQVGAVAGQIDALFIPDQADAMPAVAAALASSGIKTQLLGTGVWNDGRVLRLPQLQGAWFSAPDNAGFNCAGAALQGQVQQRPDPARDALLRRGHARRRARAKLRTASASAR